MKELMVHAKQHDYRILLKESILEDAFSLIRETFPGRRLIFLVDEKVHDLYGLNGLEPAILIHASEKTKTLKTVKKIYGHLKDLSVTRNDLLVSIGGGVVLDMAGFVASTYLRGLDYVNIPTTLLAMVDVTIGGKVGVNFQGVKNQIGAFYPPSLVLIDPVFTSTLTTREFNNGLVEVLKVFFLRNQSRLHDLLKSESFDLEELVLEALMIKKYYVEADEEDLGIRQFLNLGHTYGHAIEAGYRYRYKHGEAVWLGMGIILKNHSLFALYRALTEKYQLPERKRPFPKQLVRYLTFDKKRVGDLIPLVCFDEKNQPFLNEMTIEECEDRL